MHSIFHVKSETASNLTSAGEMHFLIGISTLVFSTLTRNCWGLLDYETSTSARIHLLQVPTFTTPLPPVDTRCYTFDLYLNENTLSSELIEDFILFRNTAIIRRNEVCGVGEDFSSNRKYKSSFCAETEVRFDTEIMCNANQRSSLIVCRKWWGERQNELGNGAMFPNNPPNPKNIQALCAIFPNKPWCDPKEVCVWYPTIPSCRRGNGQGQTMPLLPLPAPGHDDVWYIAGILHDNHYLVHDKCESSEVMIRSSDIFLRLTTPKGMVF